MGWSVGIGLGRPRTEAPRTSFCSPSALPRYTARCWPAGRARVRDRVLDLRPQRAGLRALARGRGRERAPSPGRADGRGEAPTSGGLRGPFTPDRVDPGVGLHPPRERIGARRSRAGTARLLIALVLSRMAGLCSAHESHTTAQSNITGKSGPLRTARESAWLSLLPFRN